MAITYEEIIERNKLVKAKKKNELYLRVVLRRNEDRGKILPTLAPFGDDGSWLQQRAHIDYDNERYVMHSLLTDLTWEDEYM